MGNKFKGLLALLFFTILTNVSATVVVSDAVTVENSYELPPEINILIDQYQDDAYISKIILDAEQYQSPDFMHKILHPREAGFEKIDAFNKKVIYKFPSFIKTANQKTIGICNGDLIGFASQATQWLVNKTSMHALTNSLSQALVVAVQEQDEEILSLLSQKDTDAVVKQLINIVWDRKVSTQLLSSFLKYRLVHAGLEYFKKQVTPPLAFLHGKTTDGRLVDEEASQTMPISSILPMEFVESIIDPAINGNLLVSNKDFYSNTRNEELAFNIASQYAVEGAKQYDFIGTVDEKLFFIVAKETALGMLFFHDNLRQAMTAILEGALNARSEQLRYLLNQNHKTQRDLTLTADERDAEQKKYTQALATFFNKMLQQREKTLQAHFKSAHRNYNTLVNGLLLTPILYRVGSFGWNLFKSMRAAQASAASQK